MKKLRVKKLSLNLSLSKNNKIERKIFLLSLPLNSNILKVQAYFLNSLKLFEEVKSRLGFSKQLMVLNSSLSWIIIKFYFDLSLKCFDF